MTPREKRDALIAQIDACIDDGFASVDTLCRRINALADRFVCAASIDDGFPSLQSRLIGTALVLAAGALLILFTW